MMRLCVDCGVVERSTPKVPRCRPCNAAHMREYRRRSPEVVKRVNAASYKRNAEKVKAAAQEYRDRNRDRVRAWNRDYYRSGKRDRTVSSERNKRNYAARRDQIRLRHAAWRKANPNVTAMHLAARRARERGAVSYRVTDRDWKRLIARYGGCCAYCGIRSDRLERDHVIPVTRGGNHSIGNLLPACLSCNRSKWKWLLCEWRYQRNGGVRVA